MESARKYLLRYNNSLMLFLATAMMCEVVPGAFGSEAAGNSSNSTHAQHVSFHVASFRYEVVEMPMAITVWIFVATIAKIGFHKAKRLSHVFPESVMLIALGVVIGLLLFFTHLVRVSPLTPHTFFMFLLPPIILDAGYFMPNRAFFDNLGTILLYAVLGTVFNTLTIGLSLYGVGLTGLYGVRIDILEAFLFSALISAVDPVAVLAVFEAVHVNELLYIVVFGESLLNDAVTVVLYNMFSAYSEMGESLVGAEEVMLGLLSFFVVALGGTLIGMLWGVITAFVTRFTNDVRVVEPLVVFIGAYLAHLTAEMFHLSGILAVTFCGICSKNYVEANISLKSHTTLKYTMKMLSSVSETIIFLFLGVSTVNGSHNWNTWFIVFTIFFCSLYRAIGVLLLTWIANKFRVNKLNKVDEFVMAYGGLRGAVAFALALTIEKGIVAHKDMFVTATIAMVFFTVFFQGATIRPLVQLLRVKRSEKRKLTMNERIHERFLDHLMAGIEEIIGSTGNFHLRDKFKYYDTHYIRKWLVREEGAAEPKIIETFTKLNVRDLREMSSPTSNYLAMPSMTNEGSLAALLRNYTHTNLEVLRRGSSNSALTSGGAMNVCNLDIQELDYSPSAKDLNDVKIHHILQDCMFQTPKRHHRFSRVVLDEVEPSHPPFKHQMRMQIRRLLSENLRSKKNQLVTKNGSGCNSNMEPEEDGIVFMAKGSSGSLAKEKEDDGGLPWRREESNEGVLILVNDEPIRQNEFPAWVQNEEYNPHFSPTDTLLQRIESRDRLPSAQNIFTFDQPPNSCSSLGSIAQDNESQV